MKLKISTLILTLCFGGSLAAQDQEDSQSQIGTYSAGAKLVHLYDIGAYRFDTELSKDLKGLNGEFTGFNVGLDIYGEKQFTPLFGIQAGLRFGAMNGANETEHYQNHFHEFYGDMIFVLSNMDRNRIDSKFNFYGKLGGGVGIYRAERYLNSDGSLNNEIRSSFWEARIGAGAQYKFSERIRFELDLAYNMVLDDGFDGFNNASGRDPYLSTGVGVAYTFGKSVTKPMYSVNFFSEEYSGLDKSMLIAEIQADQEASEMEQKEEFSEFSSRIDSLVAWQSKRIDELSTQNMQLENRLKSQEEILAGDKSDEEEMANKEVNNPLEDKAEISADKENLSEEELTEIPESLEKANSAEASNKNTP